MPDPSPARLDAQGRQVGQIVMYVLDGGGNAIPFPTSAPLADAVANPTTPMIASPIMQFNGTTWNRSRESTADAMPSTGISAVGPMVFGGATWDRPRTPKVFKSAATAAAGNAALWTPTAAKKFRLMQFKIMVTGDASLAAAGVLTIGLQDSATDLGLSHSIWLPAAAAGVVPASTFDSGWTDIGNGALSAVANNVLNINLSAALTSGTVRVIAAGTEE